MASRLALKYGLVPEEDRLPTSPDATIVSEPNTGSKARTKGSLYLIVTSRVSSGRARDVCEMVANSVRREYYYDESGGISIVLEKAIRVANRELHKLRGGPGVAEGSLGLAAAVVRGNELYVASCGDAESYLIRSARLLMPEHEPASGLPTSADPLRVDVWRGEFAVGDSLVLAAHSVVEAVGTDELKNAVITLHPQSAVEHLHHLYVAAGGEGSDALIAIEASEAALARGEHGLVPIETLESAPVRHLGAPVPLGDQVTGPGAAVSDRAAAARAALREGVSGLVGRVLDAMPRRRTSYRRISPTTSKLETRRRAAMAVLGFIGVITVLGIGLWAWNPLRAEIPIEQVTSGEEALAAANAKSDRVFGREDLLNADPPEAVDLLRQALDDLDRAATGDVDEQAIARLRAQVIEGLEELYGTVEVTGAPFYAAPGGQQLASLVSGPDDAAYVIAGDSVVRVDPQTRASAVIFAAGAGPGQGIGAPRLLARGGPDLLILDARAALWRWRPSDSAGNGTLGPIRVAGDQVWDESVVDIETFVVNADQGLYRMYVPYPAENQILRYEPTADGSGFSVPAPYFVGEDEDVTAFRQLYIDGDVYAVTGANLLRYFGGALTNFALDEPPDNEDLRPGHDYALMAATGTRGVGLLVVWDQLHSRILIYDKSEGTPARQFIAAPGTAPLAELRGMYLVDRGAARAPILVYARPEGIYQVALDEQQEPAPTPSPSPSPRPSQTIRPGPSGPSPEPTDRPRRTPRATPSP